MNLLVLIEQGIALQKNGNFVEAERIYLQVMAEDRNNADAHHLLALLKNSQGMTREALNLVNIAIDINRNAIFLNSRGIIFIDLKLYQEAQNDLRASLKLDPAYPEAYNNLAITFQRLGNLSKASKCVKKAIDIRSNFAQAWATLGSIQFAAKKYDEAVQSFNKAIELDPISKLPLINLAKIDYVRGQNDESLRKFSILDSEGVNTADLAYPHAQLLIANGQLAKASDLLLRAYRNTRDWSDLRNLIGQGEFFTVLYKSCSYFTDVLGDTAAALELYRVTAEHVPEMGHVIWNNVAKIYYDTHQVDEGIQYAQRALNSEVTTPEAKAMAFNNLGVFYLAKEDSFNAIQNFNKALELLPGQVHALGWLLKEKAHICDWDGYGELRQQVDAIRLTENRVSIAPFTPLSVYNDPNALKYWAELTAHEVFDATALQAPRMKLSVERRPGKVRIGYYSYDFRDHPVAHLTARLFEVHDKAEFEIYAYSYGPDDGSAVRQRIKDNADVFVDLKALSVLQTAQRIANDDIDLLIDLTGNTRHHRCQVLALRPARKQAHWLGFIGTMGSVFYDYIIGDSIVTPLEDRPYFTENILHINSGFHIADDMRHVEPCKESRSSLGLPEEGIVFGCFAQTFKIQPEHFDSWMQILRQVPGSVLWIANGPPGATDNLKKEMGKRGVDPERMIVAQRCGRSEYLSRFSIMDVHLDTFPYTSGTVASDALYGGCPLVSLSGKTMVSKMAGSILTQAGFTELVAQTSQEFVDIAVNLALNHNHRKKIRKELLQKSNSGCLFSVKNIVHDLEQSCKSMLLCR